MKHTYLVVVILCGILSITHSRLSGVPLSNKAGKTINVEILKIEPKRIFIRLENRNKFWLERSRLSEESLQMIAELEAEQQSKYEIINDLLGISLLQDNYLWDDAAESVAERLNWKLESKTDSQSGYRHYPVENYILLGTNAYACALYGMDGKVVQLSIVFANKGDFEFSPIPTKDEIEAMEEIVERDENLLFKHLSEVLGEPVRQSYGAGGSLRERIQRWDWQGHAFLLASQKGEYISLRIMSSEAAENRGRGERFSDARLRKLTRGNVCSHENGDVIIKNIPMVNQGPKGYCVPATFERYLRYMQIQADMYLLAMAGQTGIGGGTYLSKIIEAVERYLSSQNRSLKGMRETIDTRMVRKYVDDGLPMIWAMYSSGQYNQYANNRTIERQSVTDWDAWRKKLKEKDRKIKFWKDVNAAHACLIIGYNEGTGEIAVSDSWGAEYEERWVSAEHAEQVSQGLIYLISF